MSALTLRKEGSKAMPFRRCLAQSHWPRGQRLVCSRAVGPWIQEWSRQDVHVGCLGLSGRLANPHHHSELQSHSLQRESGTRTMAWSLKEVTSHCSTFYSSHIGTPIISRHLPQGPPEWKLLAQGFSVLSGRKGRVPLSL